MRAWVSLSSFLNQTIRMAFEDLVPDLSFHFDTAQIGMHSEPSRSQADKALGFCALKDSALDLLIAGRWPSCWSVGLGPPDLALHLRRRVWAARFSIAYAIGQLGSCFPGLVSHYNNDS